MHMLNCVYTYICTLCKYVCMYKSVYMYIHVYEHICVYIYMYICTYVYVYLCMCIYICVYVCNQTWIQKWLSPCLTCPLLGFANSGLSSLIATAGQQRHGLRGGRKKCITSSSNTAYNTALDMALYLHLIEAPLLKEVRKCPVTTCM